jgi:hypothetical protein
MRNRYGLLLAFLLVAMSFGSVFQAQAKDDDIEISTLPSLLGTSNTGTDFWFHFPPNWIQTGTENSMKVYIAAGAVGKCTLEIPGIGKTIIKETKRNDVIEFTLSPSEGQVYERQSERGTALTEEQIYAIGQGRGIHVTSEVPIIVYAVSRITFTTDSFLAVPTSALGREYIIGSWPDVTARFTGQHLPSQVVIVAAYDNTKVFFKLGGSSGTKTMGGMVRGQTKSFDLKKKGDLVMFTGATAAIGVATEPQDLSGSKITSTRPVAVISGSQCSYVPFDVSCCCDFMMEMELPTHTWGKMYHVPYFPKRKLYQPMKILAKEANTTIYREGKTTPFYKIATGGGNAGTGYYEGFQLDDGSKPHPVVYKADKPISVVLFNSSQGHDGVESDPFQLNLTPIEQYQKEIIFNTPGIRGGQGYSENYVALVFEGNMDGSFPEGLEFAIVENGEFKWESLASVFGGTAEAFAMWPGDTRRFLHKTLTLPGDGVYKIRSSKPFAAYAYGFGSYDSYGHPTSVALGDLTKKDTVAPDFKYAQYCNGDVDSGRVTDMPNDLAFRSNLALVTLLDGSYNYDLKVKEFIAGEDRSTDWQLFVRDRSKDALAYVSFSDRANNDTVAEIRYFAPSIKIDNNTLNYGLLKVGQKQTRKFEIRNTSTATPQNVTKLYIKGAQGFTLVPAPTLPEVIAPGDKRSYDIEFSSPVEGEFKDSVIIEINGCVVMGAELIARVGEPIINVTDAPFGTVATKINRLKEFTVSNRGTVELTITGYTLPATDEFTIPTTGPDANKWNISAAKPMKIAPGASENLAVNFKSDVAGVFADEIRFISDTKKEGVDSVALLTARTVEGNLSIEGYVWPRQRINTSNTNTQAVKIYNTGTADIRIVSGSIDPSVAGTVNSGSITMNPIGIGDVTVGPGDTVFLSATFLPTVTGDHVSFFRITTDEGNTLDAELKGFGIRGDVAITPVVEFGQTLVNGSNPTTRKVSIKAIKLDALPNDQSISDSVVITDLVVNPAGAIGINGGGAYGDLGFRFDKASVLNGTLVIQAGDSVVFDADFIAKSTNDVEATLTVVSNSDQPEGSVFSTWRGSGITEGIDPDFIGGPYCIDEDGIATLIIVNNNNTVAQITNIEAINVSPNATFVPMETSFDIPAFGTRNVSFQVKASQPGTHTATILISRGSLAQQQHEASFETREYRRTTTISRTLEASVDESVNASIVMNNGANFELAEVRRLSVELSYDPKVVQLDQNSLAPLANFTIENPSFNKGAGTAAFDLVATGNNTLPTSNELTLVTMKFNAYLNGRPFDSTDIVQTVTADNTCLKIDNNPGLITVNPVCGGNVRRISLTPTQYALNSVNPNPVSGSQAEIGFAIGLKGHTTIEVFDANGVVVGQLINNELEEGEYKVTVNTQNMNSGLYFYRIVSGPFTETKELRIVK